MRLLHLGIGIETDTGLFTRYQTFLDMGLFLSQQQFKYTPKT